MDNLDTTTTGTESETSYGNLEITVQGMTKDQLDTLLDFITEKVESMGLIMVAHAYMTKDSDYPDDEDDADDPAETKEEGESNAQKDDPTA
jgi:hypothetical protein